MRGGQRPRIYCGGDGRLHEQEDDGDDEEVNKAAHGHVPDPVPEIDCETVLAGSCNPHVLLRLQNGGQRS